MRRALRRLLAAWTRRFRLVSVFEDEESDLEEALLPDRVDTTRVVRGLDETAGLLYALVRDRVHRHVAESFFDALSKDRRPARAAWYLALAREQERSPLSCVVGESVIPLFEERAERVFQEARAKDIELDPLWVMLVEVSLQLVGRAYSERMAELTYDAVRIDRAADIVVSSRLYDGGRYWDELFAHLGHLPL